MAADWRTSVPAAAQHFAKLLTTIDDLRKLTADFPQAHYEECKKLIASVARKCPFMIDDPTKSHPHYAEIVKRPIWLKKITERLENCDYTNSKGFIDDMRLLFSNCYKFNIDTSEAAELARDAEIEVELAFVRKLGVPPVHSNEIRTAVKKLGPADKEDLKKLFCRYNKTEYQRGAQITINMDNLQDALKRQILVFAESRSATSQQPRKRPLPQPSARPAPPTRGAVVGQPTSDVVNEVSEEFHRLDPVPVNPQNETFPSPDEDYGAGGYSP